MSELFSTQSMEVFNFFPRFHLLSYWEKNSYVTEKHGTKSELFENFVLVKLCPRIFKMPPEIFRKISKKGQSKSNWICSAYPEGQNVQIRAQLVCSGLLFRLTLDQPCSKCNTTTGKSGMLISQTNPIYPQKCHGFIRRGRG